MDSDRKTCKGNYDRDAVLRVHPSISESEEKLVRGSLASTNSRCSSDSEINSKKFMTERCRREERREGQRNKNKVILDGQSEDQKVRFRHRTA